MLKALEVCQISIIQRLKANHNIVDVYFDTEQVCQISIIQRLKANHNAVKAVVVPIEGVPNINYSKIESKSQPRGSSSENRQRCAKYQLFKD